MKNNLFELDQLCFSYGEDHVLQQISATVAEGEFIGIIGPNGGGKTTFLKLLMGLLKPTAGKLKKPDQEYRVGYVPQIAAFDRSFPVTVREVVLMGLLSKLNWFGKYPKSGDEQLKKALSRVALSDLENAPFCSLSGGQMQRALIARALIDNPKILILDEPTANIDSKTQAILFQLLGELKGEVTILMVTHHLEQSAPLLDRLFCIQRELTVVPKEAICNHFALGTYHLPKSTDKGCCHD